MFRPSFLAKDAFLMHHSSSVLGRWWLHRRLCSLMDRSYFSLCQVSCHSLHLVNLVQMLSVTAPPCGRQYWVIVHQSTFQVTWHPWSGPLPLLSGPLWLGVVVLVRVPSIHQIDLFRNHLHFERTVYQKTS